MQPTFAQLVGSWARREHFASSSDAVAGARVFAVSGCLNCHAYAGAGSSNLGGGNLTAEGSRHRGVAFQVKHLKHPGTTMPSFLGLGERRLRLLATFLEASKGDKR